MMQARFPTSSRLLDYGTSDDGAHFLGKIKELGEEEALLHLHTLEHERQNVRSLWIANFIHLPFSPSPFYTWKETR